LALSAHYDALEARAPRERETALMAALPRQLAHAKQNAPGWAQILKDVDAAAVTMLAALPAREVLLAQLAGGLAAPLSTMAGLLAAPLRNLGYALVQLREQREAAPAA